MDPVASGFWARLKANRPAYALTILITLAVGILIGTVISKGVKGQERKRFRCDSVDHPLAAEALEPSSRRSPSNWNRAWSTSIPNRPLRIRIAGAAEAIRISSSRTIKIPLTISSISFSAGRDRATVPIREHSLGSGVIVDAKGYIVTNRHVVEKADRIRVKLHGRSAGRFARRQGDRLRSGN